MCTGVGCPLAAKCYRHTAPKSDYRQAFFTEPPIFEGECTKFINNENYD